MQLPRFGAEGQARIGAARVLVVGCGALGTVVCEQLVRAGVGSRGGSGSGSLTIVDRDTVELSNLQRQTLFTEQDARRGVPKAEAAKARLAQVHSTAVVRAFVDDLHAANALDYAKRCDLIVDCLDNFETRALLNDCAVALRLPFMYGGAVGLTGMSAALLPHGEGVHAAFGGSVGWSDARTTPCLRCLMPDLPAPGEVASCESAGILGATAGIVASLQAGTALRLLAEGAEHVPAQLVRFDLSSLRFESVSLAGARDASCSCCMARRFAALESPHATAGCRVVCGRNAVEVHLGGALGEEEFARLESRLRGAGVVASSLHGGTRLVKVDLSAQGEGPTGISVLAGDAATLAIVDGTRDLEQARATIARWIGV